MTAIRQFEDIDNPDCDRYPSLGYIGLAKLRGPVSPGCAAQMCAEGHVMTHGFGGRTLSRT